METTLLAPAETTEQTLTQKWDNYNKLAGELATLGIRQEVVALQVEVADLKQKVASLIAFLTQEA